MKKKTLLLSSLLAFVTFCFQKEVSALIIPTPVDGTIIIRWIDYGDLRHERPDEINLVVVNPDLSNKHETINLKATDATVSIDKDDHAITEWKFTKHGYGNYFFTHEAPSRDFRLEYSDVENILGGTLTGYNYIDSMSKGYLRPTQESMTGAVLESAGTLVVTLVKDTLKTKNLTVTYNDCQARDKLVRGLNFAIKGGNVTDPETKNAYYRFNISSTATINGNDNVDTYTKSIMISDTDAYQTGNPKIDYIFEEDTQNMPRRTIDYKIDGDNILVTVNYQAKTNIVPIKLEWIDNDNKLGLRPSNLVMKAYDQNGYLEKEITLDENSNWITNATLFENMRYSNGTPIDYDMQLDINDNYEYTISKDDKGYKVTARLKGLKVLPSDEKEPSTLVSTKVDDINNTVIDKEQEENNPHTGNFIIGYIIMFHLSLIGLIITLKPRKKLIRGI